jgi:hypothetical protein
MTEPEPPTIPLGSTWDELMAPCVHEAGHGVIGHLVGALVVHLRVDPPGLGTGDTCIKPDGPLMDVLVRVAGRAAEERYCEMVGDCPADRRPMHSAIDDNEKALEAAKELCLGDIAAARNLVDQSRKIVATLVVEEWPRIERVALGLYESPDRFLKRRKFLELFDQAICSQ